MQPSQYDIEKIKNIYFMGIGGTGMAAVAGLCQQAGFNVSGSDGAIYPPMSTLLEDLKIPVFTPYAPENLSRAKPDLVIVANALSRGHKELEAMLSAENIPYTSFPDLLGRAFLEGTTSVTVTGTHGKTTTTSLISFILERLGADPSYFIGGIPKDFSRSFKLGKGSTFVLEGDEYDTAYFDKGPKFLHYRPNVAIINAIEFDHADIYKNVDEIKIRFGELVGILSSKDHCIANADDPHIIEVIEKSKLAAKVVWISPYKKNNSSDVWIESVEPSDGGMKLIVHSRRFGKTEFSTKLLGPHNAANIVHAVAAIVALEETSKLPKVSLENLRRAIADFSGVRRRLDLLDQVHGISIYEDFAHHPTAVEFTIDTLRRYHPGRRVVIAFEPKNATGRRNTFEEQYARVFSKADEVLVGECPVDLRIPENERMDTTRLAAKSGNHVKAFKHNEELLESLASSARPGDVIAFLSSSSFSGCQHRLGKVLREKSF